MTTNLLILPQALGVFLAADLVTGVVHWLEDVYAAESMPFIGRHVARTSKVGNGAINGLNGLVK